MTSVSQNHTELTFKQKGMLIFCFFVGSIIILTVYFNNKRLESKSMAQNFETISSKLANAIEKEFTVNLESLFSVKALYIVSDSVSRSSFEKFTTQIISKNESMSAISWVPKVTHQDRRSYELKAQMEGFPDFNFMERSDGQLIIADDRDMYLPVYYINPYVGNEAALGYDLASNSVRRSALKKAARTNEIVITGRINLVQESSSQKAILAIVPLIEQDSLLGYFTGVFRVKSLINSAIDDIITGISNMTIFDLSGSEGEQLMLQIKTNQSSNLPDNAMFEPPSGIHSTKIIDIADRKWLLLSTPTPSYLKSFSGSANLMILIYFSVLLGFIYYLFTNFREINLKRHNESIILTKNKELKHFTYVASHDLNEPLHTIINFTELLKKKYHGQLEEDAVKYLNYIQTASSNMTLLVKGLLEYSRIGASPIISDVDCNELIQKIKEEIKTDNLDTNVYFDPVQLPVVSGHEEELMVLFRHLIGNAIKYRKPDIMLQIQIFSIKENNFWKFGIRDNGIGIDSKHRDRIFSIFQRLHTRGAYQGVGVGLALCHKIVDAHGGRIWVDSDPNIGSTFYFTIPY